MATIAYTCTGDPRLGIQLENGKWRVLIGWNHTNDTPDALGEGAIWCWVSEPPEKLQIFDQDFNRSKTRGEITDCGVANFTMIRMFHPYWTTLGRVPRDGVSKDKRECRYKYHDLIAKYRANLGLPLDEDPEEYAGRLEKERNERRVQRKALAALRRSLPPARTGRDVQVQRNDEDIIPGMLEVVPGGSTQDPMCVPEDDTFHGSRRARDGCVDSGTKDNPVEID